MSTSDSPHLEFSVKLCAAVKKHKCLHDQNSYHKYISAECENAWQLVALECDETVEHCKNRWKSLRRCFFQGLKRRGNRYYLHEHLSFLQESNKRAIKRKHGDVFVKNDDDGSSLQNSEIETINVCDDDGKSITSQTTSADESHEMEENNEVGVFIIDEISENTNEEANNFVQQDRFSYDQSGSRSIEPKQMNESGGGEPEKKRPRNAATEIKTSANEIGKHKQLKVRVDKLKINLTQKRVETFRPKMIDRNTNTDHRATRDFATQYDLSSLDFDDFFMQSIQTQLDHMNGRQKFNFKCKVYQSLLEVFDDATDFPKNNEVLKTPRTQAPPAVNTTIGEMRLMRELISLVQAAKNTPEIVNANENLQTSTPNKNKSPLKMPLPIVENSNKSRTPPLSLSPTTDDEDFQLLIDSIDNNNDSALARPLGESKAKPGEPTKTISEDTSRGLPSCILQKLVKAAGPTGSTIVTRDGDKRRVYRIYPKKITPVDNRTPPTKNVDHVGNSKSSQEKNNANSGTLFVSSSKHPEDINKNNNGITLRSFSNKLGNNTNETSKSANQNNQSSSYNYAANGQTIFKAIHPTNRVLSPTTGFFRMVSTTKTLTPTHIQKPIAQSAGSAQSKMITTKQPVNTMLPPTSNSVTKRSADVRLGTHLARRRYSICVPPAESNLQEKSFSQIKISQPISLSTTRLNTTPSTTQHMLSSQNRKTTTSSPGADEQKSEPIKPLKLSTETVSKKHPDALVKNSAAKNNEIPILQTAGTVEADILDPLFIKHPQIKSEPVTE